MRVLALDIGDVRTGIAVSDPDGRVASPVCVLPTQELRNFSKSFRCVLDDWQPEKLVCGLPLTLAGKEGSQVAHIREIAEEVSAQANMPCVFVDERLSSREAKQSMRDLGYDEKSMRGKIDMVAASLFLQTWLDSQSASSES